MRVRLVMRYGDEETIARAAWVSYGTHGRAADAADVARIVRYLVTHEHTTPLEHVCFAFHLTVPIFVARQLMRHRAMSWNERSLRYVRGVVPVRWLWRWRLHGPPPPGKSKQGRSPDPLSLPRAFLGNAVMSAAAAVSAASYRLLLALGVAAEQARAVLPLATTTELAVRVDAHNLLHLLRLRLAPDAQAETRLVARAMAAFVARELPTVWAAAEVADIDPAPAGAVLWDEEKGWQRSG